MQHKIVNKLKHLQSKMFFLVGNRGYSDADIFMLAIWPYNIRLLKMIFLNFQTNNFQVVLITNGRYSFCIFNYGNMTWTKGQASQETAQVGDLTIYDDCSEGISKPQACTSKGYYHLWWYWLHSLEIWPSTVMAVIMLKCLYK